MASSNVCFNEGVNCTCSSPPPVLPPRPDFCTQTTTTAEPTTTPTTEPTTTPTPTAETTESTTTGTVPTEGTSTVRTTTCHPNAVGCHSGNDTSPPVGLIVGCTCGAIIFIIILGVGIWWFWKKGKLCFRSQDDAGKTGSQECLPGGEEKQVELVNIKKGTVILNPLNKPPQLPPLEDDPPPKPPINNTAPGLTPVEGPKEEAGVSPSQTTQGRPESATSKKSRRGSRSNKVSPTPEPETK